MKVNVILLNGNSRLLTLESHEKSGKHLLNRVFALLGLQDCTKYFGLSYRDREDGDTNWLTESDDLASTLGKVKSLQFGVRFYPKRPEDEIIDDKALELFCFHLKEMLVKGDLACDVHLHADLDALLAQALLGDYRPSKHKPGYLKRIGGIEICAPTFLNSDRDVKEAEYLREVSLKHRRNLGIRPDDAYRLFVSKVRTLPYFGFTIHRVKGKKCSTTILGLSEKGLTIISDKLVDRLQFPQETEFFHWSGLRYCDRSRGKLLLGFEIGPDNIRELSYKVKSKNSFCGAERLRRDIFGYRDVFAKENSEFYSSRRKAKREGVVSPVDRSARKGFSRLNSISDTLRRSFKVKKNTRARMKRGSEGDITAASELDDTLTTTVGANTTHVIDVTQISAS